MVGTTKTTSTDCLSEQEDTTNVYQKYWGNFIGGSDDSLNLVAF